MKKYKSKTNPNVTYELITCVTDKHKLGGTKLVLRKTLRAKKIFRFMCGLINIPYTKTIRTVEILWKPIINSPHKGNWVFIKNNFNDYDKEWSNIKVQRIVSNKSFKKLLEQIKTNSE